MEAFILTENIISESKIRIDNIPIIFLVPQSSAQCSSTDIDSPFYFTTLFRPMNINLYSALKFTGL